MLKEQLLGLAVKAIARAYETREKLIKKLEAEKAFAYVRNLKDMAIWLIENRLSQLAPSEHLRSKGGSTKGGSKVRVTRSVHASASGSVQPSNLVLKKERKSSIRPAKEIDSPRAEAILHLLKHDASKLVKASDQLLGKKSLAYLVWALGHAERASVSAGISVHDVSALLYRACKIELYPINISRVIHSNEALVKQAGQEKRTKTYLLTPAGAKIFHEKFM